MNSAKTTNNSVLTLKSGIWGNSLLSENSQNEQRGCIHRSGPRTLAPIRDLVPHHRRGPEDRGPPRRPPGHVEGRQGSGLCRGAYAAPPASTPAVRDEAPHLQFLFIKVLQPLKGHDLVKAVEESFGLFLHASRKTPLCHQTEMKTLFNRGNLHVRRQVRNSKRP